MLKVFGRNNNQLFRKSKKQTYSMPQSFKFEPQVRKCACGYDFIAVITTANSLYFVYEAEFYPIENIENIQDVATSENTVAVVTMSGEVYVWDFDYDKVMQGVVNYSSVKLTVNKGDYIKKVEMGANDIFLLSEDGKVYHFQRNQWYKTKSYSNIESIELNQKIVEISAGEKNNLFLTYEGELLTSSKENPLQLKEVKTQHRFIKISTSSYSAGLTKKGVIMIWGKSIHGNFKEPTEFYKLTKKFVDIKLDTQNGYAIADDGEIWVWGSNSNGQLGLSDYETRIKPFPLITLDSFTGIEIFCGEAYTCCLCYPNQKGAVKVIQRKTQSFRCEQNIKVTPAKNKKNATFDEKSVSKKKECCSKVSLQRIGKIHERSVSKCKKMDVQREKSQQSKSLTPKNKSGKKYYFPNAKSGRKTPSKTSMNDPKAMKLSNFKLQNAVDMKILGKDNSLPEKWQQECSEEETEREKQKEEVIELRQENELLKEKVTHQNDIINDITSKIRLLEEAIDEYQKNLSARDNVVEQFQQKQQEYISHINQLQMKVDEIVHSVHKNNEVTVIYESIKEDFDRERQYYLEKLSKIEEMFAEEREKYIQQIDSLKGNAKKREPITQLKRGNKENSYGVWDYHSPIASKKECSVRRIEKIENEVGNGHSNRGMEQMIEKIQSNKVRITKSANKLIEMLDMSSSS